MNKTMTTLTVCLLLTSVSGAAGPDIAVIPSSAAS